LLHGWVVDMFYFPIWQGQFPAWFPLWGGEAFEFFRPVFNLADAAITVGILWLILFQRHEFATVGQQHPEPIVPPAPSSVEAGSDAGKEAPPQG
jgi:lipoprotein signal peptidase